jgi:hypothetical protein
MQSAYTMTIKRSVPESFGDRRQSRVKRANKWSEAEWKKLCKLKDEGLSFP